jgi:hypothetical protein
MARQRAGKSPLYELMKTRSSTAVDHGEPVERPVREPAGSSDGGGWIAWLSPGRAVTLPVGYVLLASAVVAMIVVAAYVGGYQRAQRAERHRYEQELLAQTGALNIGDRPRDPLRGQRAAPVGTSDSLAELGEREGDERPGGGNGTGWGPVEHDPRQEGFWYFVLLETDRFERAREVVKFCRGEQLETYMVVSNNSPLRRMVIALPGFPRSTPRTSPEAKTVEDRIHSIGTRWALLGGATDLHDAYPMTYIPPGP